MDRDDTSRPVRSSYHASRSFPLPEQPEGPTTRYADRDLPLADQFYHIDLDAYCSTQDRVIEVASFECD